MPIDVNELKRKKATAVAGMREIVAEAEKRDDKSLTSEERQKSDDLQKQAESLNEEIKRAEFLNSEELRHVDDHSDEDRTGFSSFGAFLTAVRNGDSANLEQRNVSMGDGESAGFLVPEQYDTEIRALQPQNGVVRPNATVIPAGSSPDAAFNLTTLDQTGDKGVYGGVQTFWTGENGTVQNGGDPKVKQVKVEPNNISAWIDISNKLLNNTDAASSLVQSLLAGAMMGAEEDAFWTGDGVAKPLGVVNAKATIKLDRTTSGEVKYEDLVDMFTRVTGTSLKWVINRSVLKDLMTMVATGTNNLAWQPSAIPGVPPTLLGIPVEYNPYSPFLGTSGDIALVDLSQYVIKDGTSLAMFMDPYTQRGVGNTRIYASWNVDGQSMLSDSMLAQDKVTTVSPFVMLK